ncbi:MAG TPA: helix-turn-helix transcriptional regulator [Acidimicrobiales bacterium]|nr:helix-turn-helix transcriptional regulator [Acidimicrobiales bacterium]
MPKKYMKSPALAARHQAEREATGRVLRRLRHEAALTQLALATRLGWAQTKVSSLELGQMELTLEMGRALEDALGLERGALWVACGIVELDGIDVETALLADPALDDVGRSAMVELYRGLVKASRQLRAPTAR